jgi:hypothetical protein
VAKGGKVAEGRRIRLEDSEEVSCESRREGDDESKINGRLLKSV